MTINSGVMVKLTVSTPLSRLYLVFAHYMLLCLFYASSCVFLCNQFKSSVLRNTLELLLFCPVLESHPSPLS